MYEVSDQYLEAVAGQSRYFPTRCKFDGIDEYITQRHIRSGSYVNIIDGNNVISMGNACANKVEMKIVNFTEPFVWKGSKFSIEKGLSVLGDINWVPWGTFWVTEMSTSNDKRTINLTAYDFMFKLSKMKYKTALVAPFHYRDLLDEFLSLTGMTLNTTAELPEVDDADYTILSWPEGDFSYSDIAGHLAGMVGCNARVSTADPTVMEFVWYTPTATKIQNTLYQDGFEKLADSALRVDYFITGSNSEIEIENTDDSTDGELDFRQFDSEDPADYPWLVFTYNDEALTASVKINSNYADDTTPIKIPRALNYNGEIYNVTWIPADGFRGCLATEIILPDTLESIGNIAFGSCTGLTSLTIPASVKTLSTNLIQYCDNLKTLYYNALNASCSSSSGVFDSHYLTRIIIGEGVETLPEAFARGSKNLVYVNLPSTLKSIASYAFAGTALTTITIPESVTAIYGNAFNGCASLSEVNFSEGLTSVSSYIFRNCDLITSLRLPNSLKTINSYAFAYMDGLTSVQIGSSAACAISSIGSYAFRYDDAITDITIYKSAGSVSNSPWGAANATITWAG